MSLFAGGTTKQHYTGCIVTYPARLGLAVITFQPFLMRLVKTAL